MINLDLKKDILNIKVQLEIQKIHASLTMLTLGVLAFISTFIWYLERLIFGIALSLMVILISLIFYSKAKKSIKGLIRDMEKLKQSH